MTAPELHITNMDGETILVSSQVIPRTLEEVFAFFSKAENLETLTPPWLGFRILTPLPLVMREGAHIDYRIRLHGFPMRWRTLISVWEKPFRFVDEQVRGPYRKWRHEHRFEAVEGGVLCRDRVEYIVPGGTLVNRLLVEPDVRKIFLFRQRQMAALFPPRSMDVAV